MKKKLYIIFIFLLIGFNLFAQGNVIRPYVLVVNSEGGIDEKVVNEISYALLQKLLISFQGKENIKICDSDSWRHAEFILVSLDKERRATYGIKEDQKIIIPNNTNAVILCEIKSKSGIVSSIYFKGYCLQNGTEGPTLSIENFFISEAYEYSPDNEYKVMDIEHLKYRTKIVSEIYKKGWSDDNINKFVNGITKAECLKKKVETIKDARVYNNTSSQNVDEFIMEDNSTLTIKDVTQWTLNAGKVIIGKDCKIIANGIDVKINAKDYQIKGLTINTNDTNGNNGKVSFNDKDEHPDGVSVYEIYPDILVKEVIRKQKTYTTSSQNVDEFIMEDNSTLTIKDVTQWTLNAGKVIIGKDCKIIANGVDVVINANIIENGKNLSIDISGSCIDENGSVIFNGEYEVTQSVWNINKSMNKECCWLCGLPEPKRNELLKEETIKKMAYLQMKIKTMVLKSSANVNISKTTLGDIRRQAKEDALKIFISPDAIMEVSKLDGNGNEIIREAKVNDYFNDLIVLAEKVYDEINIEYSHTGINNIEEINNTTYIINGSFCQTFKGIGKHSYFDYTIKTVTVRVKEIDTGDGKPMLEVYIIRVSVDETNRTGCFKS